MAKKITKREARFKKTVGTTSGRLELAKKKKASVGLTSGVERIQRRRRRTGTTETAGRTSRKR